MIEIHESTIYWYNGRSDNFSLKNGFIEYIQFDGKKCVGSLEERDGYLTISWSDEDNWKKVNVSFLLPRKISTRFVHLFIFF